jgi:hypothetical protein
MTHQRALAKPRFSATIKRKRHWTHSLTGQPDSRFCQRCGMDATDPKIAQRCHPTRVLI